MRPRLSPLSPRRVRRWWTVHVKPWPHDDQLRYRNIRMMSPSVSRTLNDTVTAVTALRRVTQAEAEHVAELVPHPVWSNDLLLCAAGAPDEWIVESRRIAETPFRDTDPPHATVVTNRLRFDRLEVWQRWRGCGIPADEAGQWLRLMCDLEFVTPFSRSTTSGRWDKALRAARRAWAGVENPELWWQAGYGHAEAQSVLAAIPSDDRAALMTRLRVVSALGTEKPA